MIISIQKQQLLHIIKQYISCAIYMCNLLKDEFQISNECLLYAYRQKKIPKEGKLLNHHVKFSFHGGGCYFEFESGTIDIEFGTDRRCDGFDSFRLHDFMLTNKIFHIQVLELCLLEQELKEMYEDGIIVQPGLYPNPNLYYLNENVEIDEFAGIRM